MLDRRGCLRLVSGALSVACFRGSTTFPTTVADRVELRYKTPGPRPSGVKATRDGLWILDQATAKAYLCEFATGLVKLELETGLSRPAALESDEVGLWIAAEDGRAMVRLDFVQTEDGKIEMDKIRRKTEFAVPGFGPPKWGRAREAMDPIGAQGVAWRRGELFLAVPAAAAIHVLKQDGSPIRSLDAPGLRPQGLAWDPDGTLWCTDGNSRSFFKMDPAQGTILKQHMLPFAAPEVDGKAITPYGLTIWQRMIYFCSRETGELYRTPLVNRME